MPINLLIVAPIDYSLALPEKPTKKQQAIHDAIQSIDGQWSLAGTDGTNNLFIVITRTSDLQGVRDLIKGYALPLTIKHAQDAQKSLVVDANGPVLDKYGNEQHAVTIHKQATQTELLPFMAPVRTYDKAGKMISAKPATVVNLPQYGGHEGWQI